jgi:hypothetical protein
MVSVEEPAARRLEARERLVDLRLKDPPPLSGFCERIRDVVVIASSSRGGSSVFAEILRHSPHLLHFRAEVNPFLVLAGLGFPESGQDSDALFASSLPGDSALEDLLCHDAGNLATCLSGQDARAGFARELAWRLSLQWPQSAFDPSLVAEGMQTALCHLASGSADGDAPALTARLDVQRFHTAFLACIRSVHAEVNPWYYDLGETLVRGLCPDVPLPVGPPGDVVLEEPPFVTVAPWRPVDDRRISSCPLVIKTPANAYRLRFLRALFPNARLRVLHLTRNAAAAINGLFDGWRYRGFFAHRIENALDIAGYSDVFSQWGRSWWKFDLPPGWEKVTRRPLVEVCAYQWRSAHEAILAFGSEADDVLRIRFEDVVCGSARRKETFEEIIHWLGIPADPALTRVVEEGLPPIMATDQPRHRRWYDKADLLEPVLASAPVRDLMEALGYDHDPATWT